MLETPAVVPTQARQPPECASRKNPLGLSHLATNQCRSAPVGRASSFTQASKLIVAGLNAASSAIETRRLPACVVCRAPSESPAGSPAAPRVMAPTEPAAVPLRPLPLESANVPVVSPRRQ